MILLLQVTVTAHSPLPSEVEMDLSASVFLHLELQTFDDTFAVLVELLVIKDGRIPFAVFS